MTKLSALGIDALAYSGKQQTHFDATLPGFGVRVGKKAKTFVLMVGRERKLHSLGRYPAISLKSARTAALRLLAEQDGTKHVKPRVKALEAIEAFMVEKQAQARAETLKVYNRTLRTHLKGIHQKNIEDVTTDDITSVTDKLLKAGKKASANQVLIQSKTFLKWCVKRRLIPHSPAEGLDKPARQTNRKRVLSDQELRTVWRAADATGHPFGDIVKLLILTGQRRTEIGSLQTSWCSLPSSKDGEVSSPSAPLAVGGEDTNDCVDTWGSVPRTELHAQIPTNVSQRICTITFPSEITKNRLEHLLPLSALCVDIITPRTKSGTTFLFPAADKIKSFNNWSKGKEDLDKKIAKGKDKLSPPFEHWTLHDLRRTYVTNLQRLKVPLEVREALVNHISGASKSGVAGVYNLYEYWDERVEAVNTFETWFTKTIISD